MRLFLLGFLMVFALSIQSQDRGYYFGPKGGLTLGTQKWDGYDRNPMLNFHGALFTESLDPDFTGSVYAQIGWHTRGSSVRAVSFNGFNFSNGFQFNNVSIGMGLKKRYDRIDALIPFYFVGIRVEYTFDTNLDTYSLAQTLFYPVDFYVNKWNYGLSFGGGFEKEVSEFFIPYIEFGIHPDISFQYRQPPLDNITNPYTGQLTNLGERRIRNLTLEITLGFKFLRKVIIED